MAQDQATTQLNSSPTTVEEDDEDSTASVAMMDHTVHDHFHAKKEAERTFMVRVMLAIMLFLAVAVTILAYFLLVWEEQRNFKTAFEKVAETVADAAGRHQKTLINSMDSFAHEVTAFAQASSLTWPFVHLPLFESYAIKYFEKSHGEFVALDTIVDHDDRESYINWTNQHYEEWIQESHMIRYGNLDRLDQNTSKYNPYISQRTLTGFPPDEIRPYYTVRHYQSPPVRAYGPLINMNIATLPGNGQLLDGMYALKSDTLVTRIKPFVALPEEEHKGFHTDSNANNPHSFMFQPIYDRVQPDPDHAKIVGSIATAVAWDASMLNLLPDNVEGILCVVRNSCNQSFTYRIDGPKANFLDDGDHHDTKFDGMEVGVNLSFHKHPNFTSTPGHCIYYMDVYPTKDFEDAYHTDLPVIFAVTVLSTFLLVALAFFFYDLHMQKRNNELVKDNAKSDKILSSLFPGQIKDQLLREQPVATTNNNASENPRRSRRINPIPQNTPMAHEYEATTIFFGDLKGFTAWSSSRTPEQVFELLEHLYSTFDKLAKARGVYKIETIGDCYVAATGLPEPQSDHAVRMARFANDLMQVFGTLTSQVTDTLGPDTTDLMLRVGLHSGSITGGVLKGDKSRFQLFGDTMNTASRMESNGVPGRIHVSQHTADQLVAANKEHWLIERQDKIVAKGKGEMHTFFVVIPPKGSISSGGDLSSGILVEGDNGDDEPAPLSNDAV